VPREETERWGDRFGAHPTGSGPFVLEEWVRGVRVRFQRNARYFLEGQPRVEGVEVLLNVDCTTQAMMIDRGEIDLQMLITDPDFLRFKKDPARQPLLECISGTSPLCVSLNCELPPFTNRLVRQALNHAVNKQAVVKKLLHRAVPARGALPMTVRGFNPHLPEYAYDPAQAKSLLAQAGYGDGFKTTLWVARDNPAYLKVALAVEQDLKAVGVIAQLKEVSYPTLTDAIQRRKTVPMGVFDWQATINDPKDTLDFLLNPANLADEACYNTAFYSNARVQQLFAQAAVDPNAERRLRLYQQIEQLVVADAPWIFVCHMNNEVIRQPWLKGYRTREIWPASRLEAAWLER
jgi:peptide/nickel transport system substrate-binding protein